LLGKKREAVGWEGKRRTLSETNKNGKIEQGEKKRRKLQVEHLSCLEVTSQPWLRQQSFEERRASARKE
jgi:hypothetical protein